MNISRPGTAATGKPSAFYKPEIDVIRFIAFFLVFLHHILPDTLDGYPDSMPQAYARILSATANSFGFGLCLFFFLSAYLITTLLILEDREYGRIDIKSFYVRRILRIWPLYFLGLFIGIAYAVARHRPEQLPMFKYFALFIVNFYFGNHDWSNNPVTPLWSISVEEQFYIALPLLLAMTGARRASWIGGGFIVLSSSALIVQGEYHLKPIPKIWTNTLSQLVFMGAGILCATLTAKYEIRCRPATRIMLAILSGALFFCASYFFGIQSTMPASSGFLVLAGYIAVAAGCVFILFSFLNAPPPPPALAYLGKISYGLYVYHMLNIGIAGHLAPKYMLPMQLLSLFPTIAISMISYRYFELPFLRLRKKFTYIKNRPE